MTRPYALLRSGFPYDRTLGMRRLTNTPVDLAVSGDGTLFILCRGGANSFVRQLTMEDETPGAVNLTGGAAQTGGTHAVGANFVWPASLVMDSDENLWVADEGTHQVSSFTKEGELLRQWGELGSEDGQLNRPSGIAFDLDENLYVVDTQNHRIQKFTGDGEYLASFGGFGDGEGQFDMPWGIEVDELGDIYVADWRNDMVQKLTPDGQFIFQIGGTGSEDGEFNRPSGVTVDRHGDIYVADRGNNRVQLFNSHGGFVEKFIGDATLGKQAHGYMVTNLMALRLREMSSLEPQKRLRAPISVRVDGDGRMYIADYGSHRIQVYKKEAYPLGPDEIAAELKSPSLYTQF